MGARPGLKFLVHQIGLKFKRIFIVCYSGSQRHQKANMSFKLSDSSASPSQELLDLAKKSDLLDIAEHYELPNVKRSMLKYEIKNILIQFFVDEEIFDSSATSQILVTQTDLQLRELEIKRQLEIEKN